MPVLLCYPSGIEFVTAFIACLYAGAIPVPAYAPGNTRHAFRIRAILEDSGAALVLAAGSPVEQIRIWLQGDGGAAGVEVIDTDLVCDDAAAEWRPVAVQPAAPAFLQYTSGSTSTPKGVMVSHSNLLRNGDAIRESIALHPDSLTVSWLPMFHDMGLVLTLVAPLLTGTPLVMMSPAAFVQRPIRWLNAVSSYRATHSASPNFALELVVDRTTPAQRKLLDLSGWETCVTGSEPLRKSTLERFNDAFAASGFSPEAHVPAYGLAEATLFVTCKRLGEPVATRLIRGAALQKNHATKAEPEETGSIDVVCSGGQVLDTVVEIVDPETRLRVSCAQIGEIWVRGPGIATGYWQRPEASEQTFKARLADSGEGPFLRTGDLGFLHEGGLHVTGRIKDMVILRGQNHYPNDIELTVENSHPALKRGNGAAFGVIVDGEEKLVVVQEVDRTSLRGLDVPATLATIRASVVAAHEVDVHDVVLIAPLEAPKTSSGKIQRSRARERYLTDEFKMVGSLRTSLPTPRHPEFGSVPPELPVYNKSQDAIKQWLVARIARLLGVATIEIDINRAFEFFGIDSIVVVQLADELTQWLGRPLPPTLLYNFPDIASLSRHLAGASLENQQPASTAGAHEAIAIVGVGLRFPGADTPQEYWEQLLRGADLVEEVPTTRWADESVSIGDKGSPGQLASASAGFIRGVDEFDAEFFGISPREAVDLDPQQRVLLEVAWTALEDAGIAPSSLAGTDAGVFLGISTRDYAEIISGAGPGSLGPYFGTGTAASAAAGRVSYFLGLQGPSLVVDTACSSSLVAIHLASQSLRNGECEVALAGGVNLLLSSAFSIALSQARMLSPAGRCKTFDESADGYVRGEGCGVIVLKRLGDAIDQGDHIHAILRGTAINHDGRSNGLTAPSASAQERVIRSALQAASVSPREVGYVEAHGTGTPLGDPIEVEALAAVFGPHQADRERAVLGSVKTNIGHLEAAAGIAGLIKVVLALKNGQIPAHLHLNQPNPAIDWETMPFVVPDTATRWPADRARRLAGVSSFGFVGTNAHVVLEAPPDVPAATSDGAHHGGSHLLCLSARTEEGLTALTAGYASMLADPAAPNLGEVCTTAAAGRSHFRHRVALITESAADMQAGLSSTISGNVKSPSGCWIRRGEQTAGPSTRVGFLFTGQGSQYPGMASGLYESEPTFRQALDQCAQVMEPHLPISLLSVLHPSDANDLRIHQTEFSQPALFAVEWALAQMWIAWGLTPSALIGHSIGEYVAACLAEVFTLEEAATLVVARGRAMQSLPTGGAMVAVAATEPFILEAISRGHETVAIAAVNAPSQCVISGEATAVRSLTAVLEESDIACEPLTVSHAFHSPLMEPALDEIDRALASVNFQTPRIPIFSNLFGREAAAGEIDNAVYWRRQVTGTVRFADCVAAAGECGTNTFVEVGPQPILTSLARRTLEARTGILAPSLRQRSDDQRQVTEALATLYTAGVDINWRAVCQHRGHARAALPGYPFQRQRFWNETHTAPIRSDRAAHAQKLFSDDDHPLLGQRVPLGDVKQHTWTKRVDIETVDWLIDHQIDGTVVFPGMGFIENGLAAASEALDETSLQLFDITFDRPLVLHAHEHWDLQAQVTREGRGARVHLYSREGGSVGEWAHHCSMNARPPDTIDPVITSGDRAKVMARCSTAVSAADFYEQWDRRGNHWGPGFQGIVELRTAAGEAIAQLQAPTNIAAQCALHPAHPAILDACVQTLAATVGESRAGSFVGKSIGSMRVHSQLGESPLWSHAVLSSALTSGTRTISGDVFVTDRDEQIVIEMRDVRFEFLDVTSPAARIPELWTHDTEWTSVAAGSDMALPSSWLIAHCDEDQKDAELVRAALETIDNRARLVSLGPVEDSMHGIADRLHALILAASNVVERSADSPENLMMLTRDAWHLPGDAPTVSPFGAAVWGLGRTLAAEHPELALTLVDLDPAHREANFVQLAAHLAGTAAENQLAIRDQNLLVPRLSRKSVSHDDEFQIRADSTYLITGGFGALGLRVARWLVGHGCRHVALLGRTALPARGGWHEWDPASDMGRCIADILAMEALGARVHAVTLDLTDTLSLESWLAQHRREMHPPIRGVIHAAGHIEQSPSLELDRATLREHLAAKLGGAHTLDKLFADDELEAFVLFSSASVVLGSPGLAAYAAANSGLDALASLRRARGGAALSVQWGAWSGGGMADAAIVAAGSARAVDTIEPDEALRLLDTLWQSPSAVMAVLPMDWKSWESRYPSLAKTPYLSRLIRQVETKTDDASIRRELAASPPQDRLKVVTRWLVSQVAQVLRADESTIDPNQPLTGLGLDSLMALEIRSRIQEGLSVSVPLVEMVRGATIEQIVSLIEQRSEEALVTTNVARVPSEEIGGRPWPLSHGQQAQWLLHSLNPGSASYHVAFSARVTSTVNIPAMRRAWQALRHKHVMLRTRWTRNEDGLAQQVNDEFAESFETASGYSTQLTIESDLLAAYRRPFDLEQGEVARLHLFTRNETDHTLLLVAHHIACDGWSLWILLDELKSMYASEHAGRPAPLEAPEQSYIDFVNWEHSLLSGPEGDRQRKYWGERLAGDLSAVDLPVDRDRPTLQTGRGASHSFHLPATLRETLMGLAVAQDVTVVTVFAAALASLLHRYSGQSDLLIGMPATGRTEGAFTGVVGHFVNQVVLRTDLHGDPGFLTVLARTRDAVLEAMDSQNLPFVDIVNHLRPDRAAGLSPLFQVNFVYQRAQQAGELLELMSSTDPALSVDWGGLQLRPHTLRQQEGQFDLTVEVMDTGTSLSGVVKYNPDMFDPETITRFESHYMNLLTSAAHTPELTISQLQLLSSDESVLALSHWSGGKEEWTITDCLHHAFERVAHAAPGAIALLHDGRELTYGELNRKANQIAALLGREGVGRESIVALLFEPGMTMVCAILGVMKAGGTYLPLDPSHPDERIEFMLDDSGARILLTQGGLADRLADHGRLTMDLEREASALEAEPGHDLDVPLSPANSAYCIYTSGTTGRPKGVLVEHRQAARLFQATKRQFSFTSDDVWTLFHSYAFDFSVWEIWGALLHGGQLLIVPRNVARDPDIFHAQVCEYGVTVLNQTPSAFREFQLAHERSPERDSSALRLLIFGGEALDTRTLRGWKSAANGLPSIVNMYGITETTVHVTQTIVDPSGSEQHCDIGVPLSDMQVYLLDAHMQPVPVGIRAELYVGGAGVARGYLGQPALTAERFVPHPFSISAGARLYRTGDLGRHRSDGSIEYLGRIDRQVKIRGFRIERGEVEARLRGMNGVHDAIVCALKGAGGEDALHAYVTLSPGTSPDTLELRTQLRAALPEHMVPAVIHTLETYPLTINGKIDEEALALLGTSPTEAIEAVVPALSSNDSEAAVAEVWREILGVESIGRFDNFFDLGGHSLLVPRVHRLLKDRFNKDISMVDMFRHTTLADLATHLHGEEKSRDPLALSEDRAKMRQVRRTGRTHGKLPS